MASAPCRAPRHTAFCPLHAVGSVLVRRELNTSSKDPPSQNDPRKAASEWTRSEGGKGNRGRAGALNAISQAAEEGGGCEGGKKPWA